MKVLRFLILLVLMLFIVSNRFLLLQIKEVHNEEIQLNTVYASNSIQQERLPVILKVGRIYF